MNRKHLSLGDYVRRRNGVPLGGAGALTEMLRRSLGAKSITVFWQFWNPIFGYYLGRYVYRPARSVGLPNSIATIVTFCVSGGIHDLAATAVKQQLTFVCTPWFFFMAIGLLFSRLIGMDISETRWGFRAVTYLFYVGTCLILAVVLRNAAVQLPH